MRLIEREIKDRLIREIENADDNGLERILRLLHGKDDCQRTDLLACMRKINVR